MSFSSAVAQLLSLAAKIKQAVCYAKQNKRACRDIGAGVQALTAVLVDVSSKFESLPMATQDTIMRFLPKLKKHYDEAANFIDAQIKLGSVKKFNTSKSTKYVMDTLAQDLKSAKSNLIAALEDRLDPNVWVTPIPLTVGIDKYIESMFLAFKTENYVQALLLGKEILRKIPRADSCTKAAIHYDMASTYSKLCNTRNVILHLQSARAFGFLDFKQLDNDSDFDNVRYNLEFMNFRQVMEYEVLQTEKWRTMSNHTVCELTALFDSYDTEGTGRLTLDQFSELCHGALGVTSAAQVVAFWRDICEDTIEAMHLMEFLNFVAERKDLHGLFAKETPTACINSPSYIGFNPIQAPSSFLLAHHHSHITPHTHITPHYQHYQAYQPCQEEPISPNKDDDSHFVRAFAPFSVPAEGQTCGRTSGLSIRSADAPHFSTPFSYYTTTDPLANFRS